MPQVPQFAVEFIKLTSHPSLTWLLQSPHPAVQFAMAQVPALQTAVDCAVGQTLPQVPQVLVEVNKLASQPLATDPSQLPQPASQLMMPHRPPVQTVLADDTWAKLHGVEQFPHVEMDD